MALQVPLRRARGLCRRVARAFRGNGQGRAVPSSRRGKTDQDASPRRYSACDALHATCVPRFAMRVPQRSSTNSSSANPMYATLWTQRKTARRLRQDEAHPLVEGQSGDEYSTWRRRGSSFSFASSATSSRMLTAWRELGFSATLNAPRRSIHAARPARASWNQPPLLERQARRQPRVAGAPISVSWDAHSARGLLSSSSATCHMKISEAARADTPCNCVGMPVPQVVKQLGQGRPRVTWRTTSARSASPRCRATSSRRWAHYGISRWPSAPRFRRALRRLPGLGRDRSAQDRGRRVGAVAQLSAARLPTSAARRCSGRWSHISALRGPTPPCSAR